MSETTAGKKKGDRWVKRWGYEMSPRSTLPGVHRLKDGGFLTRAYVRLPTGKSQLIFRVHREVGSADAAHVWLSAEKARVRTLGAAVVAAVAGTAGNTNAGGPVAGPGEATCPTLPSFADYATSLGERKRRLGKLKSAHAREVYTSILKTHLLPAFGALRVDAIRRADVLGWMDAVSVRITAGEVSPHTANSWWSALRAILNAAVAEFELDRNPVAKVDKFSTAEHPVHTREEPNSLTGEEARAFLAAMQRKYPQHYAMTVLGFATGLRPSSLRPLRRCGPNADVLWTESALLVRRSHTRRAEVMNTTKTDLRQRIGLPESLVEVLRAHVDAIPPGPMLESELLFPSIEGGFRAPSVLDKPFKTVAKAIGLRKRITPKGMRRTFQDLARAAEVKDVVTRSISGHQTEKMQEHYSTPWESEQRAGMAQVLVLAGVGQNDGRARRAG